MADGTYRAVVIGVNETPLEPKYAPLSFAQRDASAVYEVLTAPGTGVVDESNAKLVVGEEATFGYLKRLLRDQAKTTRAEDTLIVYFSGHATATSWSKDTAFLASTDFSASLLEEDPDRGLSTHYLNQYVFGACAGRSLLVLDCCSAGAFVGRAKRQAHTTVLDALEAGAEPGGRHSMLLSCPSGVESKERAALQHGAFTYQMLEVLRGQVAGQVTPVTLDSLVTELAMSGLDDPPIGRSHNEWGRSMVLSRPMRNVPSPGFQHDRENIYPTVKDLAAPLADASDRIIELIEKLLDGQRPEDTPTAVRDRLGHLRRVLNATDVGVVRLDASPRPRTLHLVSESTDHPVAHSVIELCRAASDKGRRTLGIIGSTQAGDQSVLAIPLTAEWSRFTDVLFVLGHPSGLSDLGEPLAEILRAFVEPNPALNFDRHEATLDILTRLPYFFRAVTTPSVRHGLFRVLRQAQFAAHGLRTACVVVHRGRARSASRLGGARP